MNILLNMLSAASEPTVIDRLQAYTQTADKSIAQNQVADPDYWGSVGIITLTGILVVFMILAVLIIFFYLIGAVFKALNKRKKAKAAEAAVPAVKPEAAALPEDAKVENETSEESDGELIAVISAAIAAYTGDGGFTVTSVRKHADNRVRGAWSAAGISENTRPF